MIYTIQQALLDYKPTKDNSAYEEARFIIKRLRINLKWYVFKPNTPSNRQKLPTVKKYVLVQIKNLEVGQQNPVCIGYLKYHAGVKSEPYFVTPGCSIDSPLTDDRILRWCDCLPGDFEYP